ncbi:MAG TPA: TonB-dependent siderophore receptor [Stellaceae bacterium]|jgi:catecholate siderophore receptor|nr:TonB-dependent siderophore receptor [Stellaceae bacterium]
MSWQRRLFASSSAAALLTAWSGVATAQSYGDGPVQTPTVSVDSAARNGDYATPQPTLNKLTQPMRDTPQSIDTVPRQLLDDQGVSTLRDALRNVSGISLGAGENTSQGDNLTLRGFSARSDIYLDGMRDFGSYYRDPFYLEDIQVLKGPSSILFGRGSTGGVIEQDSKPAGLTPFIRGSVAFGTDFTKRVTADVNQPLGALGSGAAFRINLMAHDSNVAERDVTENSRIGIAPTLSLGLGTDTRAYFSFFHQSEYDTPDYGMPVLFQGTAGQSRQIAAPVPESVRRSNFYGFAENDFLRTNVDVATAKIEHDVNDWLTIRNQLRYAHYTRQFRITEPQLYYAPVAPGGTGTVQLVAPGTPLGSLSVSRNQLYGTSLETFIENQSDATSKFDTGFVKHTLVTGVEIGEETSDPRRFSTIGPYSTTPLTDPNSGQPYNASAFYASNTKTDAATKAFYALDTAELSDQWQLMGGGRLDRFDVNFYQQAFNNPVTGTGAGYTALQHKDDMASWRGGIVYKPLPTASVYFDAGTSFDPSAEALSLQASTANLAPVKNKTYELGAKWDVIHEGLSLRASIYRTQQTNVRETDPNNSAQMILAGDARVDGFEFEAAGHLTEKWQVYGGYSYMYGVIDKSPVQGIASDLGNRLSNVPAHTFNFWTTYQLPWPVEIGGGVNVVSSRYASSTPRLVCPTAGTCTATTPGVVAFLTRVPAYATFSAMAKYYVNEKIDLQLNVTNIFNTFYYDQVHPSHVVPGAGRTALLTVDFKY